MKNDTIELVTGDALPDLSVTLRDSNKAAAGYVLDPNDPTSWSPIDLTGRTVRMKYRKQGTTTILATISATIADAENGRCVIAWPTDVITEAGIFEGEIEVVHPDTRVQTVVERLKFKVNPGF